MAIYATLRKRFTTDALKALRFKVEGGQMVKRGAFRRELAVATSLDGIWWRVRPLERDWKH